MKWTSRLVCLNGLLTYSDNMAIHTKIKIGTLIATATTLLSLVIWVAVREIGRIDVVEAQQNKTDSALSEIKGNVEMIKADVSLIKGVLIRK